MWKYVLLFVLAAGSSVLLTPLAIALAERIGAVDQPAARRVNTRPVPRLGGVAVYAALLVALGLAFLSDRFVITTLFGYGPGLASLAFGATLVTLIGAADDVRPLSAWVKLVSQIAAALAVVAIGSPIAKVLGIDIGVWGIPVTVFWVVAVTNAFNLIDGLDGLAAGIGLIVSVTMFSLCVLQERVGAAMMLAAFAGALLGFLRYNFYPARIFLGDSGSLLIGFVLAFASIQASNKTSATVAILVPLLALGLPLADTSLAVVRRTLRVLGVVRRDEGRERYEFELRGKAAIFSPDRAHIHHRLLDMGITHRNAVLALYGISLLLCLGAFSVVVMNNPNNALILAAFALAALLGIRRLDYGEMHILRSGAFLPIFDLPLVGRRMLHVFVDLVFVITSFLAAFLIVNGDIWSEDQRLRFFSALPLVAFVQIASFAIAGLYRRSYRYTGIADLITMAEALGLATATGWLARFAARGFEPPSFAVTVLDAYILATFVIGMRISFRVVDHFFKREREGGERILIYGAGNAGVAALREMLNNPSLAMKPVGFLDDDPGKRMRILHDCPIYSPDSLEDLISRRQFDELVVASPKIVAERVRDVAERCALAGLRVRRFSIGWQEVERGDEVVGAGVQAAK